MHDSLLRWIEHVFSSRGDTTADDDRLGIEEGGDGDAWPRVMRCKKSSIHLFRVSGRASHSSSPSRYSTPELTAAHGSRHTPPPHTLPFGQQNPSPQGNSPGRQHETPSGSQTSPAAQHLPFGQQTPSSYGQQRVPLHFGPWQRHFPFEQISFGWQRLPQEPQLSISVCTFTQLRKQRISGSTHLGWQLR